MTKINIIKLAKELSKAKLPVCSVRDTEPYVDYLRELTAEERITANAIVAAHDPTEEITPTQADEIAALTSMIKMIWYATKNKTTTEEIDLMVKTGLITKEAGDTMKADIPK